MELTKEENTIVAMAQSKLQEHIRSEFKTLPNVYPGIIRKLTRAAILGLLECELDSATEEARADGKEKRGPQPPLDRSRE